MEKKNETYNFSDATLVTAEGLKIQVGCEYVNDPEFDEQMRNIEILVDSRNIDHEFIESDLKDTYNPYDIFTDFNEEGEDSEYIRFQLFFDPEKVTDETMMNELLLDVIFHLHCYWSGKLTIENF